MTILLLTTHVNPGGITSYIHLLVKGLVEQGHRVLVVSGGGTTEDALRTLGADVRTMNIRTKSELSPKIYRARGALEQLIGTERVDVIHAQTRVTQVLGTMVSRKSGRPLVTTCHGFFKARLSRRIFPCWGHRVIAISRAVVRHLIEDFEVPASGITLVSSGIELDRFRSGCSPEIRKARRQQLGVGDEPLLGIIARFSDVKGQDILLKAMPQVAAAVPGVKLLLVGEGRLESEMRSLIEELNLSSTVVMHPVVEDSADILPLLDAFVMPSRQEGLGLSIIEAMACGLPVVATRVGGIPSLIQDGLTGRLVAPENPEELANALITVLTHPEDALKMGQAGMAYVDREHAVARMITETINVYTGLSGKTV